MSLEESNNFIDEILAIANQQQTERLCQDLEWTESICYHISTLIHAFSVGILQSYPYYRGFQMPPNFEKVMNYVATKLQEEFRNSEVQGLLPHVSLLKMRGVYKRIALSCPEYVEWNVINNPTGEHGFTWSGKVTDDKPSFIDLDVPPRNACNYLRQCNRENNEFDKRFNEKYGKLS